MNTATSVVPFDWHVTDVIQTLNYLQDAKKRVYGNSWRKHGELVSIFANISRKYDRLDVFFNNDETYRLSTPDETVLDTVADLACYGGLYMTWLSDPDQLSFQGALQMACTRLLFESPPVYVNWTECVATWGSAYAQLERILVHGITVSQDNIRLLKLNQVLYLVESAVAYLAFARRDQPTEYAAWAAQWSEQKRPQPQPAKPEWHAY